MGSQRKKRGSSPTVRESANLEETPSLTVGLLPRLFAGYLKHPER